MSKLHLGDCLEVMKSMSDNSIDAVISDPPYGLSFMNKEWDSFGSDTRQPGDEHYVTPDNPYGRSKARYGYGSKLQKSMQEFQFAMTPIFEEALRVAKPGAYLLCFGGTRTFHRMACAIEDAGWKVKDCVCWLYGSGFPHGMDVARAIDKKLGVERKIIGHRETDPQKGFSKVKGFGIGSASKGGTVNQSYDLTVATSDEAREWEGWNTALKPAWEPIIVAQKPVEGTIAANVLKWGVGAMNIDACRVPVESGEKGRYPANVAHDGSQMVLDLFPQSKGQQGNVTGNEPSNTAGGVCYGEYSGRHTFAKRGDSGSAARFFNTFRDGEDSAERTYADKGSTSFAAKPGVRRAPADTPARFFYCAKASKKDRGEGNTHPTVKPTALMEWLVKLVTREGGVVLDPFMGSGSTGVACANLGRRFVGIEREWDYMQIAGPRVQGREREVGMVEADYTM